MNLTGRLIDAAAAGLPEQMAEFRKAYPGIALRLHDVVSDRCLDMVAQGEVDRGLTLPRRKHGGVGCGDAPVPPSSNTRHLTVRPELVEGSSQCNTLRQGLS